MSPDRKLPEVTYSELLKPQRRRKERASTACFLAIVPVQNFTALPISGSMTLNAKNGSNGGQGSDAGHKGYKPRVNGNKEGGREVRS